MACGWDFQHRGPSEQGRDALKVKHESFRTIRASTVRSESCGLISALILKRSFHIQLCHSSSIFADITHSSRLIVQMMQNPNSTRVQANTLVIKQCDMQCQLFRERRSSTYFTVASRFKTGLSRPFHYLLSTN